MSITVIEPHADDAFLSLGGHIKRWIEVHKRPVTICTIFSTEKRAREGREYADSIGAEYLWLGAIESGNMDTEVSMSSFQMPTIPNSWDEIVCVPLGLRHQEHYVVRRAADILYKGRQVWYYVDQPYALQQKNQDELWRESRGKTVVSIRKPRATKYNEKTIKIFKSQSKFFYFNKDMLPQITEVLLK